MPNRLNGKVAAITGATSGIGARCAEIFVAEGATVVIAGRSAERGEALAAKLGGDALFVQTDVAKEVDVKAMIDAAVARFGRLDCLFNNAAVAGPGGPIETIDWEEYSAAMDTLVGGVVMGMKHAAPVMKRQGSGSIITTSSVAGIRTGYAGSIYSTAKAAVIQLTRFVAAELGEAGVRVNAISPGGIVTPIFGVAMGLSHDVAEQKLAPVAQWLSDKQPIPRAGITDDIAQAAVYLASDESSFVNGHNLVVDGGLTLGRSWSAMTASWAELGAAFAAE